MANPADGYVVANQGFATTYEGEPVFVQKGEFVPKNHPFVEGREDLFDQATHFGRFDVPEPTPHDADDDDEVEQATAGPGEKRGAKKRS
jgi:hypothetical protein